MENLGIALIAIIALKSLVIGSDFSFHKWFKHGTLYLHYYNNRPSFEEWQKKNNKIGI